MAGKRNEGLVEPYLPPPGVVSTQALSLLRHVAVLHRTSLSSATTKCARRESQDKVEDDEARLKGLRSGRGIYPFGR